MRYAFQKVGMTSAFTEAGAQQGVTLLKLLPATVTRVDQHKNGQKVLVVEYTTGNKKNLSRGYLLDEKQEAAATGALPPPALSVGQDVKISGTSKGRGFQDAMTRHNFRGGPGSHGSRFHRAPGSVGMRAEPGRTPKGKKLPGQMGNVRLTVLSSQIAYWSPEENLLAVQGGVPGAKGSIVFI